LVKVVITGANSAVGLAVHGELQILKHFVDFASLLR